MEGGDRTSSVHTRRDRALHSIIWKNLARKDAGHQDSDDQTLGFVLSRYEAGKDRRSKWESNASLQLRWVAGDQLVMWDRIHDQFLPVDMPNVPLEHRHPVQINTLKGVVEHKIAMTMAQPIAFAARPFTNEDYDICAAEVGQKLLHYRMRASSGPMADSLTRALWIMYCTGIVFPCVEWDPWLSKIHDEADLEKSGKEKNRKGKKRYSGDVSVNWLTGFDITEPYGCTSIYKAPWVIDSQWVTLESLEARYERAEGLAPDVNYEPPSWKSELESLAGSEAESSGEPDDMILRHRVWRPDSPECPGGFFAVVAGERVLHRSALPYKHGQVPFAEMCEIPDDTFRKRCTIGNLMSLQHARNVNASSKNAHVCMSIAPRWTKEAGMAITREHMVEGQPAMIEVPVGGTGKLQPLLPPPIPADAHRLGEEFRRDMQDVSGVHDSTQGRPASAQQSGKHAVAMQAQDARMTTVTRRMIESGFAQVGRLILHCEHQFRTDESAIAITGEGMHDEVLVFKGKELYSRGESKYAKLRPAYPSGPFDFNVVVTLGVEPDQSVIMQKIEILTKLGILNPANPQHQAMILKWLGEQTIYHDDLGEQHRAKAKEENRRLLAGDAGVYVAMGDYDDGHIFEHLNFTAFDREFNEQAKKELAAEAKGEQIEQTKSVIERFRHHVRSHFFNKSERELRPQAVAAHLAAMMKQELTEGQAIPPDGGGQPPQGARPGMNGAVPGRPPGQTGMMPGQTGMMPVQAGMSPAGMGA